ncbi:hypothetical protein FB451DRAFT_1561069 [Mycena latifolia]|nr:hypothetical protein FB451DRAFT_1561069 [Mycena latifolia]
MDGTSCGGSMIRGQCLPRTTEHRGVYDGTSVKPFMFSSLALTDDDAFLGGAASHQELGTIALTIYPIRVMRSDIEPAHHLSSLTEIKVHERTKKAVTQQITLAKSEKLVRRDVFVSSQRAGPDRVKFCFKYRPMDILQANGIAPRLEQKATADPPRAPTPDADLAAAEEERILRERLKALEARRVKKENKPRMKREFESDGVIDLTQPTKKVKLEAKRPFISGEIIDLT